METNKIEIVEHGLMMSDYFHGTTGIWLNIYPTPETTKKEAIEMLEDEINITFDHIEFTAIYNGWNNSISNLSNQIDNEIKEMKKYIKGKEDELLCPDMDYIESDYDENPVYIFTIEFISD